MAPSPTRVVQVAAGNAGRLTLRQLVTDERFELVGVSTSTADRVGVDAGTLAGLDVTTGVARIVADLGVLVVLALASDEIAGSPREGETYALMLFSTAGTLILAGADDLLVLVVGFLLASIPLYGLIGIARTPAGAESAMKTYLLGSLLGILMLLGVTVLYGVTAFILFLSGGLEDGVRAGDFTVSDPTLLANTLYASGLGALQLARVGILVKEAAPGVPTVGEISHDQVRDYLVVSALALARGGGRA